MRGIARRNLAALGAAVATGLLVGVLFGFRGPAFIGAEIAVIICALFIDRVVVPELDRRGVDTGRGNIDHIAIGPGGVFTIETKSHAGRIEVDRIDPSMWRQAYAQAKWVEEATGAKATPLLVFSRAYLSRPVARRRGVTVLPARLLSGHLLRYRPALPPAEVERLTGVLLSR